ncbi:hypothetical protein P3G55_25930, partial [Leptospira sp. 96542]|nr:hypothetical protein [Leptospira sp. 96542]
MKKSIHAAVCAIAVAFTGVAQAQLVVRDGVLTGAGGRTVYTFDKDQPGTRNCSGGCLAVWP